MFNIQLNKIILSITLHYQAKTSAIFIHIIQKRCFSVLGWETFVIFSIK